MTGWFGKHLVEVAVGLLCLCTLGAWGFFAARIDDIEKTAATKQYVDDKVAAVNEGVARELKAISDKIGDMQSSMSTSNTIVAARLLDIGDRLARIEGEMKGVSGGGGVRP